MENMFGKRNRNGTDGDILYQRKEMCSEKAIVKIIMQQLLNDRMMTGVANIFLFEQKSTVTPVADNLICLDV